MLLLLPAVNYSSRLSPPPFPSAISPQSCTADQWKVLILKFTQTPNTFGTIVLVFMQQQNHFMQNHTKHHIVHSTHTKSTKRMRLLWGAAFFLNKTAYIHHNINISATGSTHLKSGPTLKEKLTGGVNWVYHFGKRAFHANYENVHSTHIKRTKQSNIEKQQTCIATSICSLLETLT